MRVFDRLVQQICRRALNVRKYAPLFQAEYQSGDLNAL